LHILTACGLRPAEILVLRMEDFDGTKLRIDEALKDREKGEARIGRTKTKESDGSVPVPPDLSREIAAWIAACPFGKAAYARFATMVLEAEPVNWVRLESSVFTAARYSDEEQSLYLEFRSGAIYRYFDFPPHQYREFLAGDSKGRYFNQQILGRFREQRVRPPYRKAS